MMTFRHLTFLTVFVFAGTIPLVGQQTIEPSGIQNGGGDPFRISPGSSFYASGSGSGKREPVPNAAAELVSDVEEAFNLIRNNYVDRNSTRQNSAVDSAIRSMLRSLDPHSNYLDPSQFGELLGEHRSQYSGTGSTIMNFRLSGVVMTYVVALAAGSPAAKAGLQFGDQIVSVNDKDVTGLSSFAVREMVRGPRGSDVRLKVKRAADGKTQTMLIRRENVPQPTVPISAMIDAKTGYIEMSVGFSYTTVSEFDQVFESLRSKGMESLIIDLRGNSGGIVDQSVAIAEKFLPAGRKIVSQRGRRPDEDREWISRNQTPELLPIVVLTDGGTASAAEIVAAAFQDNDRALIVGSRTFGKGLVQNVMELENGGGLTLTAARYFTPSGRSIQRDYTDVGLYDYFSRTEKAAVLGRSMQATRTTTDRVVYAGDGISPDVEVKARTFDPTAKPLADEIFRFTVELMEGRVTGVGSRDDIRHRILFGKTVVDNNLISEFCRFANIDETTAINRKEEIREQLSYFLSLAAFGVDSGQRSKLEFDPAISMAKAAIADAAELSNRSLATKK